MNAKPKDALIDPLFRVQMQGLKDMTSAIEGESSSDVVFSTDVYESAIKIFVLKTLKLHGWIEHEGAAICVKSYQTAVGKKEASVYLSKGDFYNRTLSAIYESEGRNQLESHSILIPVDSTVLKIIYLAGKFSENIDKVVADTYAARLYKNEN